MTDNTPVTSEQRVPLGYCLGDMPADVQQMAIDLSRALDIPPAEAYALMVERLPLT